MSQDEEDGAWLASPGPYQDRIKISCSSDPGLKSRERKAKWAQIPWPSEVSRIAVLEYGIDGFTKGVEHVDPSGIEAYLLERQQRRSSDNGGQVYIVESLTPDLIATLGDYFDIDPSVFLEQLMSRTGSRFRTLPSALHTSGCLRLSYSSLISVPPEAMNSFGLTSTTGRHIRATRSYGEFSNIGIASCICSILTRKGRDGSGWNVLVFCDPPVGSIRIGQSAKTFAIDQQAVNGGYVDFVPNSESHRYGGPPRTSLMDDLCFYLQRYPNRMPGDGVGLVFMFVQKIVASHYLVLLNHFDNHIRKVSSRMERQQDLSNFGILSVESQWSDARALRRRARLFCEFLEGNMMLLGIPFEDPTFQKNAPETDWIDCTIDFQYLRARFRQLLQETLTLSEALTGLASIAGNRQALKEQEVSLKATQLSILEARRAKALTLLGLIFIPLAYTSSLFSMADPYNPGSDRFWMYFVISLPLVFIITVAYYVLDSGYSSDGSDWSLSNVANALATMLRQDKQELEMAREGC
ncbi:uncharacterized protein K444DRAFT_558238 [Hyaloscypha bicolor E]|uniref:Cora-domain-containing protein n=1 Tax=Hyaloscypha bicolor E TaxID=1095630 RepID=A0A2J6TIQ5_9HELO|nr:uncharacterized protein K444DRAFT_558238 [Hyaloscypha bicolor E]PMD62897.1 hypothetical protein K444DRAFT_558238 [Hyaloscypha bicolor E]